MESDKIEVVLLLTGNYLFVQIPRSGIEKANEFLGRCLEESEKKRKKYCFNGNHFLGTSLIGWYFREIGQTTADRMEKLLEKKLPNANDGEGWKGS